MRSFTLVLISVFALGTAAAFAGEHKHENQSTTTHDSRQSTNKEKTDTHGVKDSQHCRAVNAC